MMGEVWDIWYNLLPAKEANVKRDLHVAAVSRG